jgi:KaiC/GvpD/RAD55 family RecA-like ATPase
MKITERSRAQIEIEFMALVLNKNEVIDLLQIKPRYLLEPENQKLLAYAIECYNIYKIVDPAKILEMHSDFDIVYYTDVFVNYMWFPNAWVQQLQVAQESILKFYKQDVINGLNQRLKNKVIDYDTFMEKMREIDAVQLVQESRVLTRNEILQSINEDKAKINFNKFPKLNKTLKMVQGDFLIVGATTGAGKSGLLINFMTDLMTGFQCIYFNMEMSKSTIYKRIVSVVADMKISDVEHPQTFEQQSLVSKTIDRIEKAELIIEHKANDITTIRATIAKMKNKNKHTIVFIDHLGLVKVDQAKSLYEQATEVAKQLRQICLEYDCTIISASQLNRGAYQSDEISLSMLKDSGELENSASKVILLYKSKDAKKEDLMQNMIFDIAKNRDGYTGTIEAVYDKEKQVFKEIK